MKKLLSVAIAVMLIAAGIMTGCAGAGVEGTGNLVTEDYELSDFKQVKADNGFYVEIIQGSSYSVEVTTDDNIREYLDVTKSGDTLTLKLKGSGISGSRTLKAKISMPDIEAVNLSGGSRAEVTGFDFQHEFSASLSGGSKLEGNINTGDIGFGISGGSNVVLKGSGGDLVIRSTSGSKAELDSFSVGNANVNIDGGGRAELNVNGTLDTVLTGGSAIVYSGESELGNVDLSGGSSLNKK
ncbi:head GIN domain-containing protein [Chloroflexota bacterium]